MTQPASQQQAHPALGEATEGEGSAADNSAAITAASDQPQRLTSESSDGTPKQEEAAKKNTGDSKEEGDDNVESSSTTSSSQEGQGSGEGYTADCSSDASSDRSGSAKNKKAKDNMIVSVNNLSLEDSTNDGTEQQTEKSENSSSCRTAEGHNKKGGKLKAPPSSKAAKDSKHSKKHHHHKRHHKKKKRPSAAESTDNPALDGTEGDCSTTDSEQQQQKHGSRRKLAQWNGIQVVHPMDPRIDISKVGYMPLSPVVGRASADGGSKQGDAPSLEHYVELMEVVRPFFSAYGFGEDGSSAPTSQGAEEGLPQGDPMASLPSSSLEAQEATSNSPGAADRATSGGDSRTSTSVSGERSTSSQSSQSAARRHVDAPLHLLSHQDIAANAPKPPPVPLQLAARQKPLAAAAAAEFYAPDDDPADEDDSDTSSMVVLARTKRKHKQSSSGASTSQGDNSSIRDSIDTNSVRRDQHPQHHPAEAVAAMEVGGENAEEEEEEDRKPAARPQAPRQQEEAPRPPIQQEEKPQPEDDDAGQEGSASSSSLSDQRIPPAAQANQPRHNNYDVAHVVTESASNTNTTTSGSGSGSGSGVNSGSNQGSSGSGNGSSGDGDEGKGSSEDVGTKEENGGASNSNSEDVNSDDRKPDDEKEIAHPTAAARRHGANAVADGGGNDSMNLDAPIPQAPSDQNYAARERKLQDKKRKRMNMRREYEEKVQQEMESSESSSTKGAILLRPGKPVTLDKVLSFTKVARMVIQAGPPFLVVHTNAAYTRLTGIDAHAAVGKPVSALLATQAPQGASGTAGQASGQQPTETDQQNHLEGYQGGQVTNADANNGQRLGQSYAEAEEVGRVRAAQASQNDSANVNLERLVAACGFGKYHVLYARARPHHMVGRNVTFVNKSGTATGALPPTASSNPADNGMRKLDDGNSDTSLISTSNADGPTDSLKCRSSISPIVSENIDSAVVTDNYQEPSHKSKRRKHHHHGSTDQQESVAALRSDGHHHHRRAFTNKDSSFIPKRYQQYVSHYAIQLELFDDSKELNDKGSMSSSSNSVEANLLGLTKDELRQQRQAAQAGEHGESQEEQQQEQEEQEDDEMASETTEASAPLTAIG